MTDKPNIVGALEELRRHCPCGAPLLSEAATALQASEAARTLAEARVGELEAKTIEVPPLPYSVKDAKRELSKGDPSGVIELAELAAYYKRLADRWRGIAAAMGYEPKSHLNVRPTDGWIVERIAKYRTQIAEARVGELETEQPIETAPRNGAMIWLLVNYSGPDADHPLADALRVWTIGFNNFDNDGEDEWKFAGWCWPHDHFTEGRGLAIGWKPVGFELEAK